MEDMSTDKKNRLWLKIVIVFVVLSTFLGLYSRFVATSGIIVHEYLIINEDLPSYFHGLKVIHITDVHFGQTIRKREFEHLVKRVNEYSPDIIIISGDLLDQHIEYTENDIRLIVRLLNSFEANIGKYIITGNHDNLQSDFDELVDKSTFTNLDDDYEIVYNGGMTPILIAGMSSVYKGPLTAPDKVMDALNAIEEYETPFNILVLHEPDIIEEISYNSFDLILAGHSHHGQIRFPLLGPLALPSYSRKFHSGPYNLGDTQLFVSNGLGTSSIRARLFNRPSINLYRLVTH